MNETTSSRNVRYEYPYNVVLGELTLRGIISDEEFANTKECTEEEYMKFLGVEKLPEYHIESVLFAISTVFRPDIFEYRYRDKMTLEQISEKVGLCSERVRQIQRINLEPVSLETPIGEEDDSHLGDFIEDKESESPVDFTTRQLLKEELYSILKDLSDREERVIRLRYGLDDNRPRTLEEVGREFGVTRERIRQIEAKAIKKLRHPTRSKRLGDYKEKL